jgi:hypothetical protein
MGAQAREYIVDVVDSEHDATYAQRVHRCVQPISPEIDSWTQSSDPSISLAV